jgi:hypothetical protein
LDGLVIDAGHLDCHDEVCQSFGLSGLGDPLRHGLQTAFGVLDFLGFHDDFAVEVTEHPFGASLRAIDRDDPETLGSGSLNASLDLPSPGLSINRFRGPLALGLFLFVAICMSPLMKVCEFLP